MQTRLAMHACPSRAPSHTGNVHAHSQPSPRMHQVMEHTYYEPPAVVETHGYRSMHPPCSQANMKRINEVIARYPPNYQASAVIPVLDLVQQMNGGWLSLSAMNKVAAVLGMQEIRVYEVRGACMRGHGQLGREAPHGGGGDSGAMCVRGEVTQSREHVHGRRESSSKERETAATAGCQKTVDPPVSPGCRHDMRTP